MYGNCRVDALDSQLISNAMMCAGVPPPQVTLLVYFWKRVFWWYGVTVAR